MATREKLTRRNPQDTKLNETATAAAHSHRKRKLATSQAQGSRKERWRGSNVAATRALTPAGERRRAEGEARKEKAKRGRSVRVGRRASRLHHGDGMCIYPCHGYAHVCMDVYGVCVYGMHGCIWYVYGMYGCGSSRLPGCPRRLFLAARLTWLPEKDWSPRPELYVGCGVWKSLGYPLITHRL